MPRGGRRPGAGAPKGNFNAVTHGLRSQQIRQIAAALARSPTYRRYLRRLAALRRKNRAAHEAGPRAAFVVSTWLRLALSDDADPPFDELSKLPPFSERHARRLARYLVSQTIKGIPRNEPKRTQKNP